MRLLVSTPDGHRHARFVDLPSFLEPGDLLVVNRSATLAASLPATGDFGPFILNLSTATLPARIGYTFCLRARGFPSTSDSRRSVCDCTVASLWFFDGERPLYAQPLAGTVAAFNLVYRKGQNSRATFWQGEAWPHSLAPATPGEGALTQILHGVAGQIRAQVGDELFQIGPGDTLIVASSDPHQRSILFPERTADAHLLLCELVDAEHGTGRATLSTHQPMTSA